jgi:DNA-3-methyladenine glycosylase I
MSYCNYVRNLPEDNVHKIYHDYHYGVEIEDDNALFGRLILEINQAGLSWDTILKKQENFREAFDNFEIARIAAYDDEKIEELLKNPGIIRNRLKINAVIYNAGRVKEIQNEFGSFNNWLKSQNSLTLAEWVKLFKSNFKFVGGEIVNEFLMSTNFLPGAHTIECPFNKR